MASPRDNTGVVRMLHDVRDAMCYRGTPVSMTKKNFNMYRNSFIKPYFNVATNPVAMKLDFSCLEDSANTLPEVATSSVCQSLKRKLKNTEAELLVSNAKIKNKEGIISLMEPANKKKCLDLENDLGHLKRQSEADQEKIRELMAQIRRLSSDEADAKSKLIEIERQKKIESDSKDRQISSLKLECSKLKSEVTEAKSEKAEAVRKLNSKIASLELELTSVTHEVERSKEFAQMLERQLKEQSAKSALANQLQKELNNSEMKIKSLECKLEADKEAALIARTMQSELKALPELRKENQQLKEELSKQKDNNVLLLEEKIWNLQEKLSQAENKSMLLAKTQAENEQLKERLAEWESLMDDKEKSNYKSPAAFSRRLSEYQKNEAIMTNEISKLTSHCNDLKSMKNQLETNAAVLNKENMKAKQTLSSYSDSIKRYQKKVFILTKELESCRKLIDSYVSANSETTFCGTNITIQYVRTLEESLTAYKGMLEKTENEIIAREQQWKDDMKKSDIDADNAVQIQKLREENAELLLKIEELQTEKLLLEEIIPEEKQVTKPAERSFKVVHMKLNPLDEAVQHNIAEFQRLQEENDKLRKRIQILEEEGASAADITMKVREKLAVEGSSDTIQGLTKKLSEVEKRCEILKDTYQKNSNQLREVFYMLTGYKIEVSNDKFTLYHMYADSPDECLIFQLSSEGNLNLIENPYTKNLKEQIDLYLLRFDSIPAFLATLTMDLFRQQTCIDMDKD